MVKPPQAIGRALEDLEARRGELAKAQRAHREAQAGIAQARREDTQAIAGALDAGEKRPGRQREARAAKRAEEAGLELEVAAERVRTAAARVNEALDAGCQSWLASIEQEWASADTATLEAVAQLRTALLTRNNLVVSRAYVRDLSDPARREATLAAARPSAGAGVVEAYIGANGSPVGAEELLSSFEAHVAQTSIGRILAGEREQAAERARGQEIQQARDEETRRREAEELAGAQRSPGPPHVVA